MEKTFEIVRTEYIWGMCETLTQYAPHIIIGVTVVITVKLTFNFVIYLLGRKDNKKEDKSNNNDN